MDKYATLSIPEQGIMLMDFREKEPSEEEFEAYLHEVDEYIKVHHHNVVVMDASKSKFMPSKLRIRQGKWIKENYDLLKNNSPLYVYVVTNVIVKMMMQGVFAVQKPPNPYQIVTSREAAMDTARKYWQEHPEDLAKCC